jgi:hypothetical protein
LVSFPFIELQRARFFASLAAIGIAPVTHVAQAMRRCSGARPGGFAAPEERWYRTVSNRFAQSCGCRRYGANPRLARDAGDADSMKGW